MADVARTLKAIHAQSAEAKIDEVIAKLKALRVTGKLLPGRSEAVEDDVQLCQSVDTSRFLMTLA